MKKTQTQRVSLYDTTLRDGTQGEGISFSVPDKLRIAQELDKFGTDYIECGWPGSNPKDAEFFAEARKLKLKHARISAFGSTRHAKNTAASDPNLKQLVAAKTPVVAIFGKTWDLHVRDALRVGNDVNLKMIATSLQFLSKRIDEVFFDAEHFFDGYRENPEYALQCLGAALEGGAKALVLCDTNGGSLPEFISATTAAVLARYPGALVGIHCHNDSGLATANTLAAVSAGARQVQGTINGLGERSGNADLTQIIPNLECKLGLQTVGEKNLRHLTETSRFVYEIANILPHDNQPFVGRSAFAHKGGIHVSAVARNSRTYEHITPESVGNERRILISELSGRSNLKAQALAGLQSDPALQQKALDKLMKLENEGYAFEAANASFELLIARLSDGHRPAFGLESYRVTSEVRYGGETVSEATLKVRVGETLHHTVAEGKDGPVDALYNALQKALSGDYPALKALRLVDYKVHIVNTRAATGAKVRVVIQSTAGTESWGTVGVSENIIEASCHALVDSMDYLLLRCCSGRGATGSKRKCTR